MPWRDLPPSLRGRTHTVSLPAGLLAVAATLAFGLAWLVGPVVVTVVFVAREDYVLAALMVPVLAWWLAGIIKEPMILGILFAAPYSTWSLIQQSRGKVNTEDLERGRYVGLAQWRPLTARERELVGPHGDELEVRAECVCGCGSVLLYPAVPPTPDELQLPGHHA